MKRALFQLFYFATFITVFFVVLLSVYGYSYDFQTREIRRLGVVTLESSNVATARLTLDNGKAYEDLHFPAELHDVPVKERRMTITKPGYMPWEYRFAVDEYYVTEIGNVLMKPKDISQMEEVYPDAVDQCFFPAEPGADVVCVEDQKKIAYVLHMDRKREMSTDILEIDTTKLEDVHWIDEDQLLFMFEEELPLVYHFTTKEWKPLELAPELSEQLKTGLLKGSYLYTRAENTGLRRMNILTGTIETRPELKLTELTMDHGKLWGKSADGWQIVDEETLALRGPVLSFTPSQVPHLSDALERPAPLYTNELNELVRRNSEDGSVDILTRFSSPVLALTPSREHAEYWMVETAEDRYLCHEKRIEPCMFLGHNSPTSYVDDVHHMLFTLQDRTLSLVDLTMDLDHERFPPVVLTK